MQLGPTEIEYAHHTALGSKTCQEIIDSLMSDITPKSISGFSDDQWLDLNIIQNAEVIRNAEAYYRTMMDSHSESWNIRDHHMISTLAQLQRYYGSGAKGIVWAHNTHIGDARHTDMAQAGMVNLGQLAREKWSEDEVSLVGFGTYQGEVIAARAWGKEQQVMEVPPAKEHSWEFVFHELLGGNGLVIFGKDEDPNMHVTRDHRAIGVVYKPELERYANYVPTTLPLRYDAWIYVDTSSALTPFEDMQLDSSEIPETYPSAV
jgi:erythromycin esterase-like protein